MSKSLAFVVVLALALFCGTSAATATAAAPEAAPMSSGLSTVLVDDTFDATAFTGLAFAPEAAATPAVSESSSEPAVVAEAAAPAPESFSRSVASSDASRRSRASRRRHTAFSDDFPVFADLDDDDEPSFRRRDRSPARLSRPSRPARSFLDNDDDERPPRSGPLGRRPWGPPPPSPRDGGRDCGCDGPMSPWSPRPRGRRPEGMFGPSEEEMAEMMAFEEEAAARAAARSGRAGPLRRGGPRRGLMAPMAAEDFDDDLMFSEPSFKDRCAAFAKALDNRDWSSISKMSHKCASLTYSNQEVPFGGHWRGSKGMKVFGERIRNSMHVDTMRTRVVAVDEGYQRCVLKSNITGTFVRSGRRFKDVALYTTIDWAMGKAGRFWIVDGGNLAHMMDAYRTKAEHAARNLTKAIVEHGPGGDVDKLVSDKAVIMLGRRGKRITGRTAVSETIKAIRAAAERFGFARESIMLPYHVMRSRHCTLIASDDNNHAGACRIYNIKTRTTSFKHLDFLYRFRFDKDGKLDRMSLVEARAFTPEELMPEHKSQGADALGLLGLGGAAGEVDLFGAAEDGEGSSDAGTESVFEAVAEVAAANEEKEASSRGVALAATMTETDAAVVADAVADSSATTETAEAAADKEKDADDDDDSDSDDDDDDEDDE